MFVFRTARVSDVLVASKQLAGGLAARLRDEWEGVAPASSCAELAAIPQKLAEIAPDSPWLWRWCSTTPHLLRYFDGSTVLPNLDIVSRPDLLDADDVRLADLHRLAALEILVDDTVRRMRFDHHADFQFASSIAPSRSIALGRLGTIILGEPTSGLSIICKSGRVRVESGPVRLDVDIEGKIIEQHGNALFWAGTSARIRAATIEVPVHDPTLTSPTWQDFPLLTAPDDARFMAAGLVSAHAWLERFAPSMANDCVALTSAVLPLRCGRANAFGSASREEAIGLTFLPQTSEVDILAESLLHEALHQFLYRIDRASPVLSKEDRVSRFYSPWRHDARPLEMVLHGAFVFSAIAALYARCALEKWPEVEPRDAVARSYRRIRQVERAMATVRRHGHLLRSGQPVALAIESEIASVHAELSSLGPEELQLAAIDAELASHAKQHSEYVF